MVGNLKKFCFSCCAGVAAVLAGASLANAETATGTISVQITLIDACTVNSVPVVAGPNGVWGRLDFGPQPTSFTTATATSTNATNSGSITIQCSNGVAPTLTLVSGLNDANAVSPRLHAMVNTLVYASYDVYQDAAFATKITNGSVFWTGLSNGSAQNVNLYGQASGSAGLIPGMYVDTLTVQLTY